jgi:hypothetical protein
MRLPPTVMQPSTAYINQPKALRARDVCRVNRKARIEGGIECVREGNVGFVGRCVGIDL